jgi:2-polyprenyl-3-methyl-5-hydroxy-6-metoxy-1,4-benzoquinol methylase
MEAETGQERSQRRRQRMLFDSAAQLYDASRLGYPGDIVDLAVTTAAAGPGSAVLEIGCGTGQLTQSLASYRFGLTAIDIGPSMIAAARRRLADAAVSFQVTSFEDFTPAGAAGACFDLIISGTAFHWIDPEIKYRKAARLLRPAGWLALLSTIEHYDDPLGAALLKMQVARSDDGGAWLTQHKPSSAEVIASTGLFQAPVATAHSQRVTRPVEAVVAVENTRATSLSWPADTRQEFTAELRHHLRSQAEVPLTQRTCLTMARVQPHPAPDVPTAKHTGR